MGGPGEVERPALEDLAAKFKPLTEAEGKLLKALPRGAIAYCGPPGNGPNHPDNNPEHGDAWNGQREIRAELVKWLCVDPDASRLVDAKGIIVAAAKITGTLDLSCESVPFPLTFLYCRFPEEIALDGAELQALCLDRSHTAAIRADGVRIARDLRLRHGFHNDGLVNVRGAQVDGNLDCDGARLTDPGCGVALNANAVQVRGSIFLRNGFRAEGEVDLVGASIGGAFDCSGASFLRSGMRVLNADGARVGGSVLFRQGFSVDGGVSLASAEFGADLDLSGADLSKDAHVSLQRARIAGGLFLREVKIGSGTRMDLSGASAGALDDDSESWPGPGHLDLDGFSYAYLRTPGSPGGRLKWLRRQLPEDDDGECRRRFHPQTYRQLAKVLRDSGREKASGRILFGLECDRDRYEDFGALERTGRLLYRNALRYGYEPRRPASVMLTAFFALGWLFVWLGSGAGLIAPTTEQSAPQAAIQAQLSQFSPMLYSLDVLLPVHAFHQEKRWWPNAESWEWCLCWSFAPPWGYLLRSWLCLQIAAGWILTGILVADFAGIVRRD